MLFEEIIGNEPIKAYLKNALQKKNLPNTLLFSGPEGVGKTLFAKALALHLLYPETEEKEKIARRIDSLNHPDFTLLEPEGKTSAHSIASIRNLIEMVRLSPFEAQAKVFVISHAERMPAVSANALLKTLEEPNLDSYIILVTSKEEELLATILSRSIKLHFKAIGEQELQALLKRWGKTDSEAKRLAQLSHGSIARASEIASFVDIEEKTRLLLDLLSAKNLSSYPDLVRYLDKINDFFDLTEENALKKHQEIELFLSHILLWYRDLSQLKITRKAHLLFFSDHFELLQKEALKPIPPLEKVHGLLENAKEALERNLKLKTVLENLFLELELI
ncbi:MAG: AAA family ATPase [Parachlamydiales bacterium]|jgi:DNA polymerase-3 subunit delta'